jgi:hypothetical protein
MSLPIAPHNAVVTDAARDTDRNTLSFARRRLLLGITGVGGSVLLSLVWLAALLTGVVRVPNDWPIASAPLGAPVNATLLVLMVFFAHATLFSVVEFIGGAIAVRERPSFVRWFIAWLRGVTVQVVVLASVAFTAALAASQLGVFGLLAVIFGASIVLVAAQGLVAKLVSSLRTETADEAVGALALEHGVRNSAVRVVHARDEAFVGGWIGVQAPTLWIPARWTAPEHRDLLAVQFARRHTQFTSGARRRGLIRAALWPVTGVALFAPLLPWSPADAAFWLALPAISTLWTFVAVLLLPSLSRPVVYNADAAAAQRVGGAKVVTAIRQLDAWQDDEPERSPGVEFIFHPVPSRANRERALARTHRKTFGGAHQQTRLTLFTSLSAFGLLGRVVHCNIGRPDLWAVYPGD